MYPVHNRSPYPDGAGFNFHKITFGELDSKTHVAPVKVRARLVHSVFSADSEHRQTPPGGQPESDSQTRKNRSASCTNFRSELRKKSRA